MDQDTIGPVRRIGCSLAHLSLGQPPDYQRQHDDEEGQGNIGDAKPS